ncbi:MAG: GTPase HflX [Nitrospinota bacterium]
MKASQVKRLSNIYRRKVDPQVVISLELTKYISSLSREIGRQIGILVDRRGRMAAVIVGDRHEIVIPRLSDYRVFPGRLRGLRCIHTHLDDEVLTQDDLTDLAILRLDLMGIINVSDDGLPTNIHLAHLIPPHASNPTWVILPPVSPFSLDIECETLISSVEREILNYYEASGEVKGKKRAILISVTNESRSVAEESLTELGELALTADIEPFKAMIMRPRTNYSNYFVGKGQIKKILLEAMANDVDSLIFNQELTPVQARTLTDFTDLIIIDRTQLILDIFGKRAKSRDGKTKVELAQLKYAITRLSAKDDALSRIRGGIGLRGPGETKMEIGRRRIKERIARLEKELKTMAKGRSLRKRGRLKSDIPLISIVGYTNAGKSTLLNLLTGSDSLAEDKLFATLDPLSRHKVLPGGREVIISDTVGFIRDLPKDLLDAFRSTLEELHDADLLIHLVDVSNRNHAKHIETIADILSELGLRDIPSITVLNKSDMLGEEELEAMSKRYSAIPISAKTKYNIEGLLNLVVSKI